MGAGNTVRERSISLADKKITTNL